MEALGNKLTNVARGIVSKKKIRYQQDGYDLDLAYITPQQIVHFPNSQAQLSPVVLPVFFARMSERVAPMASATKPRVRAARRWMRV